MQSSKVRILDLSIIDQTICRHYIRKLLCFPFPLSSRPNAAAHQLNIALHHTLRRWPYLAGVVQSVEKDGQPGYLQVSYTDVVPEPETAGIFEVRNRIHGSTINYSKLAELGMPTSSLKAPLFCPLPDAPDPSGPWPVLHVAANFIPEGLILAIYVSHSVVDGAGLGQFIKAFGDNVRECDWSVEKDNPADASDIETAEDYPWLERELITARAENVYYSRVLRICPEFIVTGLDPSPAPAKNEPNTTGRIFKFSPRSLTELRDQLRVFNEVSSDTPPRVSIFDTLAALVWTHVTRARFIFPDNSSHSSHPGYSKFGFTIDLRQRFDPPLPKDYIGNAALYTYAQLPIATLITCHPESASLTVLADAALEIRRANLAFDSDALKDRLAFMYALHDPRTLGNTINSKFGPDVFLTSWLDFGANVDFGILGAGSGRPEFIRKPYSVTDGGIIILPRTKLEGEPDDAPYEALVQLKVEDMEKLCKPGELMKWAESWVE